VKPRFFFGKRPFFVFSLFRMLLNQATTSRFFLQSPFQQIFPIFCINPCDHGIPVHIFFVDTTAILRTLNTRKYIIYNFSDKLCHVLQRALGTHITQITPRARVTISITANVTVAASSS